MTTLLWFRRDLRLDDNPALVQAIADGGPVVAVYIHDETEAGDWAPGGASRWWLHHSLFELSEAIARLGSRLILRKGPSAQAINNLVAETDATRVYWNRRYEPWSIARDQEIKSDLSKRGITARSCNSHLLREPWTITSQKGTPFKVYTPFWRSLRSFGSQEAPLDAPIALPAPDAFPSSDDLASWGLLPTAPDWSGGLREAWRPGERAAHARLESFIETAVLGYGDKRNLPAETGTSRLSPHLHFGEIGPRRIWDTAIRYARETTGGEMPRGVEVFLSEIAWREFAYHLLFHFPNLPDTPLRGEFEDFQWEDDQTGLRAWQRGLTGFPIVDAGMRELWATGWMHNRVRMITASFLIKDLLVDWRQGERWFWDTLVDADLASNSASWQWVAGCGTDAAPYFRVFNPTTQAQKFDPSGAYIRKWLPELAQLPDALIHSPSSASPLELADAGLRLGRDYPIPIVDHAMARRRALDRHQSIKNRASD